MIAPAFLCICDEEWCYCLEPDEPCSECLLGCHVWEPFGDRSGPVEVDA